MPELVVKLKGREIQRVPVTKLAMTIGRDQTCDVQIDNAGISRLHAAIRVAEGRCFAVDAGSRNGTHINGKPIRIHPLSDGDEITMGKFIVAFDANAGPPVPSGSASMDVEKLEESDDDVKPANVVGTVMMTQEQLARAHAVAAKPAPAAPVAFSDPPPPSRPWGLIVFIGLLLLGVAFAAGLAIGR